MPFKRTTIRLGFRTFRNPDARPIQGIINDTIVKFVPDAPAHPKVEIRGHGDVPLIEEIVNIASHEDAVSDFMGWNVGERANVGSFEGR